MNYKRQIFNKLIICIILITIISNLFFPISVLAKVYEYGPDSSSYGIDWRNQLEGGVIDSPGSLYSIETVDLTVSTSGIYSVNNVIGGETSAQYVICTKAPDGSLQPLPVSAYTSAGSSTMDVSQYNNSSTNTTSVYLEEGVDYYVCLVAEDGKGMWSGSPSEESSLRLNVEYIPPAEGDEISQTNISSMEFTAPTAPRHNWYSSSGGGMIDYEQVYEYEDLESISGDIESELQDGIEDSEEDNGASWYERVITWLLLLFGDGARSAIYAILGDVTIDSLVFNEYANTKLDIFKSNNSPSQNGYLENSGMLDNAGGNGVISKYFMIFRNIAISVYIVILLYIGVRILLSSTGSQRERYKVLLSDWVKGVVILGMFPYVMKYTLLINNGIVDYISNLRGSIGVSISLPSLSEGVSDSLAEEIGLTNSDIAVENGDMMEYMRSYGKATGRVIYAILYLLLLKQLLSFIVIYFKRMISVLFLIVIFPLVTITYTLDRKAFNNWFSEYMLNIFMQAFQACNYLVIMSILFTLSGGSGMPNVILTFVAFEYISKGDELLRSLFSKMSGGGANTIPKSLSEAAQTVAKVKMAKGLVNGVANLGKSVVSAGGNVSKLRDSYINSVEAKAYQKEKESKQLAEWRENSNLFMDNNVSENMKKALNLSGTESPENVKKALDKLMALQGSKASIFNVDFNNLSDAEKDKLEKLLIANKAMNETINHNRGENGALTEREININANILLDVVNGGSAGMYKDLFDYSKSKTLTDEHGNPIMNSSGSRAVTVNDIIDNMTKSRTLSKDEQNRLKNAQAFMGNITGLDTSENGINRVSESKHNRFDVAPVTKSEGDRSRRILNRFGNAGGVSQNAEIQRKRERAADLVSRMQKYKFMIDSGSSEGVSASEGMKLANEWRELSKETDSGVQNLLDQIGDATEKGKAIEANVGFNLEEFETITALAVLQDRWNLEGSEAERNELISRATEKIVDVATGKHYEVNSNGERERKAYKVDKVAKAMVQRAELDDLIEKYKDYDVITEVDYIRTNATQEQKRDSKAIDRNRKRLEMEYEREKRAQQARGELIRDVFNSRRKR